LQRSFNVETVTRLAQPARDAQRAISRARWAGGMRDGPSTVPPTPFCLTQITARCAQAVTLSMLVVPRFSTGSTSRFSNRPDDQVKPIVPYKTLCISQEDRCSSGVTAASAMRWMMAAATDAIFSEDTETGAADAMMCGRWLPAIHGASSRRRPDDATLFRHTFAFIPDTGRANRFWDQSSTTCHRVRERNMRIAASGRNAK